MQMMEASKLRAGTGNTPPDPMVEMGWLSGFPEAIGNRLDFSVSQEFEFPTTYFRLADAREIRQEQAVLIYDMTRQRILTEARKLMIERIHLNRLRHLLSRRMEQAGQLKEHYRTMLEAGEIGKLSLSQVNLQLSVLKADLEQVQSEIRLNSGRIREITGGEGFSITAEQFPLYEIPERGALDQAYAASPEATLYEREITLKKKQKQEGRNSLLVRIDELKQVLSEVDNEELLGLALEFGEISLAEYIYSTEYYLQNVRRLMEYERDLRLAEAEIMRVFL
jgi:cobalt-zinc-cadmium efflux system outer membrane protein